MVLRFAVERPSRLHKCSVKRNTGAFLGILMKPSFVFFGVDSSKVCGAQMSMSCFTKSHRLRGGLAVRDGSPEVGVSRHRRHGDGQTRVGSSISKPAL